MADSAPTALGARTTPAAGVPTSARATPAGIPQPIDQQPSTPTTVRTTPTGGVPAPSRATPTAGAPIARITPAGGVPAPATGGVPIARITPAGGERAESAAQVLVEFDRLRLEAVSLVVAAPGFRACEAVGGGHIENEGEVRHGRADCHPFEAADELHVDFAEDALIGAR